MSARRLQRVGSATARRPGRLEVIAKELESTISRDSSWAGAELAEICAELNSYVWPRPGAGRPEQLLAKIDELGYAWVERYRGDPRRGAVTELLDRVAEERRSRSQDAALGKYTADLVSGANKKFASSETAFAAVSPGARSAAAARTDFATIIEKLLPNATQMEPAAREILALEGAGRLGVTSAELAAIRTFTLRDYLYIGPASEGSRSWMKSQTTAAKAVGELPSIQKPDKGWEDKPGGPETFKMPKSGKEVKITKQATSGEDRWVTNLMEEGALHTAVAMRGLAKLPHYTGLTYRGATVRSGGVPREGATWVQPKLASTTFALDRAEFFMKSNLSKERPIGLIWVLSGGGGVDVHDFSAISFEGEVLVPPGAKYEITKVRPVKLGGGTVAGEGAEPASLLQAGLLAKKYQKNYRFYVVEAKYIGGGLHDPDSTGPTTLVDHDYNAALYFAARKQAGKLLKEAMTVEPKVTADIKRLAKSRGGRTPGPDLRTAESLAREIEVGGRTVPKDPSWQSQDAPAAIAAAEINDALRYTIVMPSSKYVRLTEDVAKKVTKLGYKQIGNVTHPWESADLYKATFAIGEVRFELRAHTKDTFATDQELQETYEQSRQAGVSSEQAEFKEAVKQRWSMVQGPKKKR